MPYIPKDRRHDIDRQFAHPQTAGELNFLITTTVWDYIKARGISYTTFNEVIGVLECAKLELYRRQISAYEDKKQIENGDVYV